MSKSSPLRSTETKKLRTGGDYLDFANRLLRAKGVAHGQGFLDEQEESLTLMSAATGLAWEKLPQCFKRELTEKERVFSSNYWTDVFWNGYPRLISSEKPGWVD